MAIAETIDPQMAKQAAVTFYSARVAPQTASAVSAVLAHEEKIPTFTMNNNQSAESPTVLYYIFNVNNGGWVIVSGDDRLEPIIAYSNEGSFPVGEIMPSHVSRWFQNYKNEIMFVIDNEIPATEAISEKWQKLENGDMEAIPEFSSAVDPLMTTKWNQGGFYNTACPGTPKSATGCVATAMAQIMKYHKHPIHGTGDHHYNENDYGTLTANFGATTYDWSEMPNEVNSANEEVATLMYQCGVSLDMDYSPAGSGTPTSKVINSLKKYFDYDDAVNGVHKASYTEAEWSQLLKDELDSSRPMQYRGSGSHGGHSFVCDGYDDNDMFHFNWGWGGNSDGFFVIDALNPAALGVGGGTGGFNSGQYAIINIQPASDQVAIPIVNIELASEIAVTPNPVDFIGNVQVNVNVMNVGTTPFIGDIEAVLYDENMKLVEVIGVHNETMGLAPGASYPGGLTFTNGVGAQGVIPGNYFVGILDRLPNGEWIAAGSTADFQNLIPIQVLHENSHGIEMNAEIPVPAQQLVQGGPAEFTVSIINKSSNNRSGNISFDVLTTNGQYIAELGIQNNVTLCAGCTTELTFSVASLNLIPGTYSFGSYELTGSAWEVVGSTDFDNPILLSVAAPPPAADAYENNNSLSVSHELTLDFAGGNTATVTTPGSNAHMVEDYDWYKIDLPAGYNYTINARIHDSEDSGNGETYTYDGTLVRGLVGDLLTPHDAIAPSMDVAGGNTFYLFVAPHYHGYTGTYLLEAMIERTISTSINDVKDNSKIRIAPNPASDFLNILTDDIQVESISVYNQLGQLLARQVSSLEVNVSSLPEGMYVLMMETNEGLVRKQFIKTNQ